MRWLPFMLDLLFACDGQNFGIITQRLDVDEFLDSPGQVTRYHLLSLSEMIEHALPICLNCERKSPQANVGLGVLSDWSARLSSRTTSAHPPVRCHTRTARL